MMLSDDLHHAWQRLSQGARGALTEQWSGVAAGALPCGAAIVDPDDRVVASGRNHAYDAAGTIETRVRYPLQHTRLAHAELNALALIPTDADHARLSLWTTQHPCVMCAAALAFVGIGAVGVIADDPSDDSSPVDIRVSRRGVAYLMLGDPLWWTVSNVLFLYNSAVQDGSRARNLRKNLDRYPALVALALDLASSDAVGQAARSGATLLDALEEQHEVLLQVSAHALRATG